MLGLPLRFALRVNNNCQDGISAMPRGLFNDPNVLVLSAVVRSRSVIVVLHLQGSREDIRVCFDCPHCVRCADAARRGFACVEGSRVRIADAGHRWHGLIGVVAKCPSLGSSHRYWTVRLDSGRTALVGNASSLVPEPTKLCHHFHGLQGWWLRRRTSVAQDCDADWSSAPVVQDCDADWSSAPVVQDCDADWSSAPVVQDCDADWSSAAPFAAVSHPANSAIPSDGLFGRRRRRRRRDCNRRWHQSEEAAVDEHGEFMDILGCMQFGEI